MRQPLTTARKVHAAFTAARVRPPVGHTMGYHFEEATDVHAWLRTGKAPRQVQLEISYVDPDWCARPATTGVYGRGGWRLIMRIGGRDLGRAGQILWTSALDGTDMRDGSGRAFT